MECHITKNEHFYIFLLLIKVLRPQKLLISILVISNNEVLKNLVETWEEVANNNREYIIDSLDVIY